MDKIKYLWWDFEDALEEKTWLKVLFTGIIIVVVLFIGSRIILGDKGNSVEEEEAIQEELVFEEMKVGLEDFTPMDEEVVFILENPEDYSLEEVKKAYNMSVVTLDHPFIEERVFLDDELEDGVYVYYEKVSEEYKEIMGLAVGLDDIGVPVKFYTPHKDQSIANLSNYTKINDEGEIEYIGVVVREGEVQEKYNNTEEFKRYLRGVINENQ